MNLVPENGPWSIYPLPDGDELIDANNDILLKFPPNIAQKTKRAIVRAPEMIALLETVVDYLDRRFLDTPDEESLVYCTEIRQLLDIIQEGKTKY